MKTETDSAGRKALLWAEIEALKNKDRLKDELRELVKRGELRVHEL